MPARKRSHSETLATTELPSPKPAKRPRPSPSPTSRLPTQRTLSSPLPLTPENLQALEDSQRSSCAADMSRPASPTRPKNNLDEKAKLVAYRIFADAGHKCPPVLEEHVQRVILAPRNPEAPVSPNASKIMRQRRVAAQQNERTGAMKRIEPFMMFRGAAEEDDRVEAVPLVYSKEDIGLNRYFLPPAPSPTVKQDWKDLSQPRPDTAIGYVTCMDARSTEPPSETAFTPEEERVMDSFCLTQYLLFPFLTSQWKTPNSGENITTAHLQSARDGAVITNYLHQFYTYAYPGQKPSIVDTAHYSLTSDLHYVQIWVHWLDEKVHMEQIFEGSLRDEAAIVKGRGILKNIVNWALGERVENIKQALPGFEMSRVNGRVPTVKGDTSTVAEVGSEITFQIPPTPESSNSEPKKKRKTTDNRGTGASALAEADYAAMSSLGSAPNLG